MSDKLISKGMITENNEVLAVYAPEEPREEKGFAINFVSIGLPQKVTDGRNTFVGDYE